MKKRILVLTLAITLVIGAFPASALAVTAASPGNNDETQIDASAPAPPDHTAETPLSISHDMPRSSMDTSNTEPLSDASKNIQVTNTADKSSAMPGEIVTYTVTITNTGDTPVDELIFIDTLGSVIVEETLNKPSSAGFSYDTGVIHVSNLGADASLTFAYPYVVNEQDVQGNRIITTITDTDGLLLAETELLYLEPKPGVDINKYADRVAATVGELISYSIVVCNTGNVALANVILTDSFGANIEDVQVPDGTTFENGVFTIAELPVRETVTITYSYTAETAGIISNDITAAIKIEDAYETISDASAQVEIIPAAQDNPETPASPEQPDIPATPSTPAVPEETEEPTVPVSPQPNRPSLSMCEEHVSYIIGYPDGCVHPEGHITRAEVATIFYRLLPDDARTAFLSDVSGFVDVNAEDWFNVAVSTLSSTGIIQGYPDGTFRPNTQVTRAELAAIAARFSRTTSGGVTAFLDVNENHWAYSYISAAEDQGWIQGHNGLYRPDDSMTRAEVMTLINRVLRRAVIAGDMLHGMITWPDNTPDKWYYEAVQEATNAHMCVRTGKKVEERTYQYEKWIRLLERPDWAALDRSWIETNRLYEPSTR